MIDPVPVALVDLPTSVHGFVCLNEYGEPCIIINARMSAEQQKKTWKHEMNHILAGDLDNDNYHEYGDPA